METAKQNALLKAVTGLETAPQVDEVSEKIKALKSQGISQKIIDSMLKARERELKQEERKANAITEPVQYTFKGHECLALPVGENGQKVSFGKPKARAIVKYYAQVKAFAES
jgi:hypothetical protein